jgi:hypothetical protein
VQYAEKALGEFPKGFFLEDLFSFVEEGLPADMVCHALRIAGSKGTHVKSLTLDICKEMRQNGIKSIPEYEQYATTKTTRSYKRTGTESSTPKDKSGVLDNLGF